MVSRPGFWSLRRKRKNATKNQTDGPVQSGASWKVDTGDNNEYSDPKTSQESYIAALEAKLAEATGIKINQFSNAAQEESEIAAQTEYINNIVISGGKAQQGIENPIIGKTLKSIYAETDETFKYEIDARLPELKYEYDALEPTISKEIMKIHHSKHHQGYVTNLNRAIEKLNAARRSDDTNSINKLAEAIVFNGGGHINHSIFWTNLSPTGGGEPTGEVASQIVLDFGSFADFKQNMIERSSSVKGSGWGWLGWNRKLSKLQIVTTQNQDPLEATTGLIPLLGIDVWEHAYYIQYKNLRSEYVERIFDIVDWENVAQRFENAQKGEIDNFDCQ